jgi:hypothetical protein
MIDFLSEHFVKAIELVKYTDLHQHELAPWVAFLKHPMSYSIDLSLIFWSRSSLNTSVIKSILQQTRKLKETQNDFGYCVVFDTYLLNKTIVVTVVNVLEFFVCTWALIGDYVMLNWRWCLLTVNEKRSLNVEFKNPWAIWKTEKESSRKSPRITYFEKDRLLR